MKKFLGLFVIICVLFSLTACMGSKPVESKEVMNSNDFSNYFSVNHSDFLVTDLTEQYGQEEYDNVVIVTDEVNNYNIEFYDFKDGTKANEMYSENSGIISDFIGEEKYTEVLMGNYSTYIASNSFNYWVISRVSDTLIYIEAPLAQKDAVDLIISDLGY